jgi:hypothetical protein
LALGALNGSQSALARAVRAARLRKQIQDALTVAGYDHLAETATSRALDRMVAQVEQLRGAAALEAFTSADMTRILALKKLARMDILAQGAEISTALWRTFARGLFAQTPIANLIDDLATTLDVEAYEARTLYDTTVNVFGRQVEAMKAKESDVFAYVGPFDIKTRPFCREHAGRVYTRPEINALDNGQTPNVFLTGGGYNCRHTWIAVSKVSEVRKLAGTEERIPAIAAQVARQLAGGRKAA